MQIKVVKTNVTWPFCIEHHINDCPNTFVMSVRTKAQKKLYTWVAPIMYHDQKWIWLPHDIRLCYTNVESNNNLSVHYEKRKSNVQA
jgi:hypothetical protein